MTVIRGKSREQFYDRLAYPQVEGRRLHTSQDRGIRRSFHPNRNAQPSS